MRTKDHVEQNAVCEEAKKQRSFIFASFFVLCNLARTKQQAIWPQKLRGKKTTITDWPFFFVHGLAIERRKKERSLKWTRAKLTFLIIILSKEVSESLARSRSFFLLSFEREREKGKIPFRIGKVFYLLSLPRRRSQSYLLFSRELMKAKWQFTLSNLLRTS